MRLNHIDQMKAIAVLCMVEVHTAAIMPPEGISVGHPAAFVAAAFGGMAAPLFVTLSGWGIHRGAQRRFAENFNNSAWIDWVLPRVALLTVCQFLVNILLNVERGGRFEWQTPGVLTLLAIAALLAPLLSRLSTANRGMLMALLMVTPLTLGDLAGPELGWFQRVDSIGLVEWLERLILNGTYPVLPWLAFVLLGSLISDLENTSKQRDSMIVLGFAITTGTIAYSAYNNMDWALTEGDAVLTFFPATMAFIIVASTFVLLTEKLLSAYSSTGSKKLSFLEPAGKLTLTIYISHFAVLGVAAIYMEGEPRLELIPAFLVTIGHTLIWIPLAIAHQKYIPEISFESLLRKISQSSR